MKCDIVYMGTEVGKFRWKTNGVISHEPDYDLSRYERQIELLKKKSQFWKTLPATGTVENSPWETSFKCSSDDDVQVFNIQPNERNKLKAGSYNFDTCGGKTILINALGGGVINMKASDMYFNGKYGHSGANAFPPCMIQNMMWNFPDAETVSIGNGGSSEFDGSLLIGGNLKMQTSGHSGRTMVLGDIIHNKGGSEFHNYPFNPDFDLPDPSDICEISTGTTSTKPDVSAKEAPPTNAPTSVPTNAPTSAPTRAAAFETIEQNGVCTEVDTSQYNQIDCSICVKGYTGGKWWPCIEKNCYGDGCVLYKKGVPI